MVALGETVAQNGQELLAEFIQYGHQKPFEEIVRRYAGMVFNVCFRITKDKHEAEDATQAVFLTLALQAKRGADIKALGPWLQQVAKRLALDNRRSKKRRKTREERHHQETTFRRECIDDLAVPSADMDELKTILHEELQKMPTKYRLPLILHYFGGLSREEMAAELNCKPSTLGVRIFRGREMLAGRLSGRGINISAAMLAAAMGYAVKRAISESLIASTAHAATAMAMGHSGAGMASANVIGLTRRASGALAIGKVKVAAITLLLSSVSLGAGAKVLGILPKIDVKQLISDQVQRMMRPLMQPFTAPLRVQIQPVKSTAPTVAAVAVNPIDLASLIPHSIPSPVNVIARATPATGAPGSAGVTPVSFANAPIQTAWGSTTGSIARVLDASPAASVAVDHSTAADDTVHASEMAGGSGASAGGTSSAMAMFHGPDAVPAAERASTNIDNSLADVMLTSNDLVVSSASGSGKNNGASVSTSTAGGPVQLVQISSIGGTVTESSTGIIRGWGIVDRTGTLQMNGKVIADGQGVDRTLNLTSFSAVQTQAVSTSAAAVTAGTIAATALASSDATNSAVAAASTATVATTPAEGNGWFAVNHGRLQLPLKASSTDSSVLTWGDAPSATNLSLVNSVRLDLKMGTQTADPTEVIPAELALLSPDRCDAPNVSQISGVPIGLWAVDPAAGDIAAAELNICYDSTLADELGASISSLELWTLGGPTDSWQPVSVNSLMVDASNHMVSGYAENFDYFAVAVTPAAGQNAEQLVAHHLSQISDSGSGGSQSVPEPVALPVLTMGIGLLGRRRHGGFKPSN